MVFSTNAIRYKMDTEALINIISHKPAIWMVKHPQFRHRTVTSALWEEIKEEFPDTEVISLRKKWKYLKYTYRKQLKKSQPNWKYFELLGFLRDQYENEESDPLSVEHNNLESAEIVEVSSPVIISASPSPSASPTFSAHNCFEEQSESLRACRKRANKDNDIQTVKAVIKKNKFETLEKQFSIADITKSDDYYFLMSLLPQIIKLPPIQKLRLRNKFHQAVLEEMTACYGKS